MASDTPTVPAAPAQTKWNAAPPAVLPPGPAQPPRFLPPAPPPASDTAPRMVLFQKPADPPPTQKPNVAPLPTPTTPAPVQPATPAPGQPLTTQPPVPGVTDQAGKDVLKLLNDPTFLNRPPAALQREKVFRQLSSDELLRKRVVSELAAEQLERDLREWERKLPTDPQKGPKPTLEMALARQKFPETPQPGKPGDAYVTKAVRENYPPGRALLEPAYVVHRKLYFEEKNAERFGWDAGIVQPVISSAYFYKDILLWPSKLASYPCERYDTSAGKCLPGYPVPYYIYPEEISLFGATVGAAAIVGTAGFVYP